MALFSRFTSESAAACGGRVFGQDSDAGPHILVAEDNPVNQMLIAAVLRPHGFQVTVVEDGLAAVKACQSVCYDLLLLDLQMPVMSGFAAVRKIRAASRARGGASPCPPIVALTASSDPEGLESGADIGLFDAVMPKPFDREKLVALIHALLLPVMPARSA